MTAMQQYAQSLLNPQDPQAQAQAPVPQGQAPVPQAQPMQAPAPPQMPALPQVAPPQVQPVADDAGRVQQALADPNQFPTGPNGERLNLNRRPDVMEYQRQGNENAQRLDNAATELDIKAQRDRMRAEADQARALAPLQDDLLKKQQQAAQYTAMLDQKVVDLKQNAAADYQHRSEYYQQKAAENPADVWGNWNNAQRVTGVVGMVAAGLSHQSAQGYIQNFADQAIAQQRREIDLMGRSFQERDNMYATYLSAYGDQKTATNAMYATYYQLAGEQMKQVAAQYANPIAQANLNQTAAGLLAKSAEHQEKMIQNVAEGGWKNINAEIEQQKLQLEREKLAHEKQKEEGLLGEDFNLAIPKEGSEKVQTVIAGTRNLTRDMEEMRALIHDPTEANYERAKALQGQITTAVRSMSDSGARIEETEKATIFDPQTITLKDFAKMKLHIEDVDDKINAVQENAARLAVDRVAAVSRGNSLREGTPLYEPYERVKNREVNQKEKSESEKRKSVAQEALDRADAQAQSEKARADEERASRSRLANASLSGMGL